MDLPDDLYQFLSQPENRKLLLPGCEIEEATLFAPEELTEVSYDVGTADFALQERRDIVPQRYYDYRAIDLVQACRNYCPSGIMFWLPTLLVYGQWDCDHHRIMTFPAKSWTDIVRQPTRYFNAMWNPKRVKHKYLRPWEAGV